MNGINKLICNICKVFDKPKCACGNSTSTLWLGGCLIDAVREVVLEEINEK